MTGFDIIILILVVVIVAAGIGAYMNHGTPSLEDMTEEVKEEKFQPRKLTIQAPTRQVNEAVKEAVGITEPKVKKEKQEKPEFPIDKPKKKRKYYPKKK